MRQRNFFVAEKGIRYAAQTRAGSDRTYETNAGVAHTRPEQFAKPGKTLRAARDRIRAPDRSAPEQESDGPRCRSCASRTRGTGESARCRNRCSTQFCGRAGETDAENGRL